MQVEAGFAGHVHVAEDEPKLVSFSIRRASARLSAVALRLPLDFRRYAYEYTYRRMVLLAASP
jgi:hypothetical protein